MDILTDKQVFIKISYDKQRLAIEAVAGDKVYDINPKPNGILTPIRTEKLTIKYTDAVFSRVTHSKYNSYLVVNRPELKKDELNSVLYFEVDPYYSTEKIELSSNPTYALFHNVEIDSGSVLVRNKLKYYIPYDRYREKIVYNSTTNTLYVVKL